MMRGWTREVLGLRDRLPTFSGQDERFALNDWADRGVNARSRIWKKWFWETNDKLPITLRGTLGYLSGNVLKLTVCIPRAQQKSQCNKHSFRAGKKSPKGLHSILIRNASWLQWCTYNMSSLEAEVRGSWCKAFLVCKVRLASQNRTHLNPTQNDQTMDWVNDVVSLLKHKGETTAITWNKEQVHESHGRGQGISWLATNVDLEILGEC